MRHKIVQTFTTYHFKVDMQISFVWVGGRKDIVKCDLGYELVPEGKNKGFHKI